MRRTRRFPPVNTCAQWTMLLPSLETHGRVGDRSAFSCWVSSGFFECVVQLLVDMSPRSEQFTEIDEVAAKVRVRLCSKVGLYTGLVKLLSVDALGRVVRWLLPLL